MAWHTAWYIYHEHTKKQVPVDVLTHSMGGLVLRYALAKVNHQDPHFPPELWIEDILTAASPNDGGKWAGAPYWTGSNSEQANQMYSGSGFTEWLQAHAGQLWELEYGPFPGRWTQVGSTEDGHVSEDSATWPRGGICYVYHDPPRYGHSGYYADAELDLNAHVEPRVCGRPDSGRVLESGPHFSRLAYSALAGLGWSQ